MSDGEDDNDDEDDEGNSVILISSDDEEGENNYNVHPLLSYVMNIIPESPELICNSNLETYSNNLVRSVIGAARSTHLIEK